MFSHFTLGTNELSRAQGFYLVLMDTLGLVLIESKHERGYAMFGPLDHSFPHLFINTPFDNLPATRGNGTHTALHARSRNAVQQFHAAAQANGGTCEGPPGLRPHYSEHYYAAYIRDPVGNKLQAVYRGKDRGKE